MTREILGEGEPSAEAAPKLLPGAIDWTKPVRTKGRKVPVTIYAVDPALKKPVVGKIHDEYAEVTDWHLNGSFHPTKGESGLDLENVPAAQAAPEPSPLSVGDWVRVLPVVLEIQDKSINITEEMVGMVGALYRVDALSDGLATVNGWAFRLEWLQRYVPEREARSAPEPSGEGSLIGYALAMRVLQSDLYANLDEVERGECDALIRAGVDRAKVEGK
jgi:hypothetical protein